MQSKLLDDILLKINIPFKEACFITPPDEDYIVYFCEVTHRGADNKNLIMECDISLEFYSENRKEENSNKIRSALDFYGVEYNETGRQWIDTEQLFQNVFQFTTIEKEK